MFAASSFQSPPHRGTVFSDCNGKFHLTSAPCFSPLLIGARCSAWAQFLRRPVSAPFQSPPHRGTVFSQRRIDLRSAGHAFQSPPHRGTVFSRALAFTLMRQIGRFQSPPHRGTVFSNPAGQDDIGGGCVSVPSSSGHGVQRTNKGRQWIITNRFQSPPHRGTVFSGALRQFKQHLEKRFSPLLIGARCSATDVGRGRQLHAIVSVPSSSGHGVQRIAR